MGRKAACDLCGTAVGAALLHVVDRYVGAVTDRVRVCDTCFPEALKVPA
jgi:hypothetical protein